MKRLATILAIGVLALTLGEHGPSTSHAQLGGVEQTPFKHLWRGALKLGLPQLGHRNWIVVADSAYPDQVKPGISTSATGVEQLEVLKTVLAELGKTKHVRPVIYLDSELPFVPEADAPGVTQYRADLKTLLGDRSVTSLPHDEIIKRLDEAGSTFRVAVLKSTMTIPYTSVFINLDCGYWSPEAEARLRAAMKEQPGDDRPARPTAQRFSDRVE